MKAFEKKKRKIKINKTFKKIKYIVLCLRKEPKLNVLFARLNKLYLGKRLNIVTS